MVRRDTHALVRQLNSILDEYNKLNKEKLRYDELASRHAAWKMRAFFGYICAQFGVMAQYVAWLMMSFLTFFLLFSVFFSFFSFLLCISIFLLLFYYFILFFSSVCTDFLFLLLLLTF
jgi:hypothetical protein